MAKQDKARQPLADILASMSDVLFPEQLGSASVAIDSADCEGDTPLHVAAWRNDCYATLALIEAGADVNAVGDMGETPLHVAIGQQNLAIVEVLLGAGARIDMRSEFGQTQRERAAEIGGQLAKLLTRAAGT